MIAPALAGHAPIATLGSVLALASLSIVYAPFARSGRWAREHICDLWAMAAVMLLPLWGFRSMLHHESARDAAGPALEPFGVAGGWADGAELFMVPGVMALWLLARLFWLSRAGSRNDAAGSAASGVVCALGMAVMFAI